MSGIDQIRERFPEYSDMPDRDLVRAIHKKFYSDIPPAEFLSRVGFNQRGVAKEPDAFDRRMKEEGGRSGSVVTDFLAGAGKSIADLGLGVKQLFGQASQQEVDETQKRDAALMNSGAGLAGNITGQIAQAVTPGLGLAGAGRALAQPGVQAAGKFLLASPATLSGAATQGGMGAAQAFLQPVGSDESRGTNTAIGAAGGALVPALGMALKGGKAAVEPLYEGGREQILARALRSAAGPNAGAVAQRLDAAVPLVPGSVPTAGEAAGSGGIAALQRAASAVDPEAYATRAAQQNEARVAALQGLTGTNASRAAAEGAREGKAGAFYRAAREKGIDPEMAEVLKPQMANLMERMPSGVMDKARELARLNGEAMGKEGSISGLHWVKMAVDDMISGGKQSGIGKQTERGLLTFKDDLLTVMDQLSPDYAAGRAAYQQLSKPLNQMDVAQEIADRSINKLTGNLQPAQFARALSDDTAAKATGFNKATLQNTMEPKQLALLNALKEDLARSVQARDLGRGAGSDTVQKLAMTNLLEQSGVPLGLMNLPGVGRVGNWAYEKADDKMRQALAAALLNTKDTAKLMRMTPSEREIQLALALRTLSPAATGGAIGLSDAR